MQTSEIRFATVLAECEHVVSTHAALVVGSVIAITASYAAGDFLPGKNAGNIALGLAVSIYGQYHFVEAALADFARPETGAKRRYNSLFGTGLFGGLGIFLGMLCFILPGIFLMGAWSISTPLVVIDGMRSRQALAESWRMTKGARLPLFLVFFAGAGGLLVVLAAILFAAEIMHLTQGSLAFSVASNLWASLMLVGGWVLGVAIYRQLQQASVGFDEVFA